MLQTYLRSAFAAAVVAGLVIGSTAVVAAEPPPDGFAVAHNLQTSNDPAGTWAKLSPAEKQAYIEAGTVTKVEAVLHAPVAVTVGAGAGTYAATSGRCWSWTWEVDGKDAVGYVVFRYFQDLGWCDNGTTITSLTWHNRRGEVDFVGWSYDQSAFPGWPTWGGIGSSSWRSFTQAEFKFCVTQFGCVQHRYPWLDMTAWAGGRGTGSVGGAN